MEILNIKISEDQPMTVLEQFMQNEFHCQICSQPLQFHYEKDEMNIGITEESCCLSCRTQTKPKVFIIQ